MNQQQGQILQICQNINEQLQIQNEDYQFNFQMLKSKHWYIQVLKIVFPYLVDKFNKIQSLTPDQAAIDAFIILLTKEQIIEDDFLDIKGKNIIKGDYQSIYYVVQLLNALIGRQLGEQGSYQNDADQQEYQEKSASVRQKKINNGQRSDLNNYLNQKSKKSSKRQANQNDDKNDTNSSKNSKQCHSVLGIDHQFEEQQENQLSSPNKAPQFQYEFESPYQQPNNQTKNLHLIKNAPLTNSYPPGMQDPKTFKQSCSEEIEDEQNSPYLHQKLQKYTSQPKLKKVTSVKKKKYDNMPPTQKKNKKLISHPTMKKQFRKATNPQAQKLTNAVKKVLKQTKTHINNQKTLNRVKSSNNFQNNRPLQQQMRAKNRQFNYYTKDYKQGMNQNQKTKKNLVVANQRNDQRLEKMLKWRQELMNQQKKAYEKSMQSKVQMKRQNYVKKINEFILFMEKEKQLQQQKDFKQNLMKQNQEAAKRMIALQQWYQDRLHMMKDKKQKQRQQRSLMHTGHKQIIKQIQKDLKKQNEKKMNDLTVKYRRHQAQLDNDLQELTQKIIKVYKKY